MSSQPRPLVVVILDGWGISFIREGNAIATADTPIMDQFARLYPTASILAAGIEVGLPWGEVGNSETGHRNIGAGQVQYQVLPRIDKAIEDGSFFTNRVFLQAVEHVKTHHSQLHLMGLVSPGGVHAHMNHLFALLDFLARHGVRERVYIHAFTDGRDTPPQSATGYLQQLEEAIGRFGVGKVASVTGRFYAMDRNENWDRTKQVYDMLTGGPRPPGASTALSAVQQSYQQNIYDEMLPPTAITRGGAPIATIADNDAVVFFNFRPDRARQLTRAFVDENFTGFERGQRAQNVFFVTMTQYDPESAAAAAFIEEPLQQPLARVISDMGLRQLHVAETEKYAHVTYYLNGGHEQPFRGEDHVLIQSSSTTDFAQEPLMAAGPITDRIIEEIGKDAYDVYFVNYANADMVGHTGNFEAAVQACAFVDRCLGRLFEATIPLGGALLVTGDHGNAEEMIHPQTGEIETDHTSNPVPLHYVHDDARRATPRTDEELARLLSSPIGVLSDIAPTVLDIVQIQKPSEMTGISLLRSLQ